MKEVTKILFVEDVLSDAELIWKVIERGMIIFDKVLVDNEQDYVAAIGSFRPDLIISDYSLPQFDGFTALTLKTAWRRIYRLSW
jgi:CheY-like chemotaxis protein